MSNLRSANTFDVKLLKTLQPTRHLELLNVIDDLRAKGLHEHVDLPQLIVCGDQSSGKSSVLAAISGVPFPKKDNLCTRFATEVVLRRDNELDNVRISVTITPSSIRPSIDRSRLESFAKELGSMEELPSTIADAADTMGLGATGGAFSADILRLEVRGPYMPQLTIVDLPGLIHSENKFQSAEDITLVNALVQDYMSQERSVILAVVSAKNDYANQIVLTKARKADPEGRRILGIITKPDTLHPGSTSESAFLALAQNQDVKFSLGWHVVRNNDSNEPTESDRDNLEFKFFETSRWSLLRESHRGVHSLRHKLSEVLFQQIKRELPGLISEILLATDETKSRLARMGRSRSSLSEKRIFVMELGQAYRDLCHAACEGLYEESFFEENNSSTESRRLRAVIQNANIEFANKMLGYPLRINAELGTEVAVRNLSSTVIQRAKILISSFRGKELPGTFNPILVGQLFRELSQPWFRLTRDHIDTIWLYARTAVVAMLEAVAEDDVRDACMKAVIDPELEQMQKEMEERHDDYMLEFRRQPITYNHYLTETVQAIQHKRERDEAVARCRGLFKTRSQLTSQDIGLIADALVQRKQHDMDDLAAQKLTDYAEAYYKVAMKRVIDEIAAHVIEPAILTRLPKILDSPKILRMPDDLIETIGAESGVRMALREALQAKLSVLNRSKLICKVYTETSAQADTAMHLHSPEELLAEVNLPSDAISLDDDAGDRTQESFDDFDDLQGKISTGVQSISNEVPEGEEEIVSYSSKQDKKKNKMAARWAYGD